MSTHEEDINSKKDASILTQEDVNEQIRSYTAALAKQLKD